jgi:hypothetical protein
MTTIVFLLSWFFTTFYDMLSHCVTSVNAAYANKKNRSKRLTFQQLSSASAASSMLLVFDVKYANASDSVVDRVI